MSTPTSEETSSSSALMEDGFLILHDVFTDEELAPLRKLTDEIIEFDKGGFRDPYAHPNCEYLDHRTDQGALYDIFQRHPPFQDMAKDDRILDAAEPILGPNIQLYENSLVYKAESGDNEVPFHQDFMSREGESDKLIAWMPMYDVDRDSGCLKAIPGSHSKGTLSWHTVEGETHHDRLDPDQFDEDEAVYLEMNAGDVLLFHQNVVHGSDRITDVSNPRYAYRVVYKSPQTDGVQVPRVGPIMLRGGDPDSLRQANLKLSAEDIEDDVPRYERIIHAIGRRLLRV